MGSETRPPALAQLVLVLFTEAVSGGKEVPASFLVHLPHKGLLERKEDPVTTCTFLITVRVISLTPSKPQTLKSVQILM